MTETITNSEKIAQDADSWATARTSGTVKSRAAEREKLAQDMAAYEAINGPVQTLPIRTYKPGKRSACFHESIKQSADGVVRKYKLTPLQKSVLKAIKNGNLTTKEIAEFCRTSPSSMRFTIGRLVRHGYIEKIDREGVFSYRVVSE